jgi:hypothetical protein
MTRRISAFWKQVSAAHAVGLVSIFTFLAFEAQVRTVGAAITNACPVPMEKGTRWVYEGKVKWTVLGSAKVKMARIRWVSEVMHSFQGANARAAVVRGFPDELAWYEPEQTAGFSVLLSVSNRMYCLKADGESRAKGLARRLSKNPRAMSASSEQFLEWPLVVGWRAAQDPPRDDTWYCWCVESAEEKALSVEGFAGRRRSKVYRLAYRTCPDHQIIEIVPGLGIVRFVYEHHGTIASADVNLISFGTPGRP